MGEVNVAAPDPVAGFLLAGLDEAGGLGIVNDDEFGVDGMRLMFCSL